MALIERIKEELKIALTDFDSAILEVVDKLPELPMESYSEIASSLNKLSVSKSMLKGYLEVIEALEKEEPVKEDA